MDKIKSLREKIYEDLQERNSLKKMAYDNCMKAITYKQTNETVFIAKDQLRTLDIGEVVKLSEGVEFHKISENKKEMVFLTVMIDGGRFNLHYHDCIEICEVKEGVMFETQRGDVKALRTYKKGERAIYDKGEKHSLYATQYTLLEVKFLDEL